jgi:hypothetical protein
VLDLSFATMFAAAHGLNWELSPGVGQFFLAITVPRLVAMELADRGR